MKRSDDGGGERTVGPLEADEATLSREGGRSLADEFLDELMPPELEWSRVVRNHPIPALVVAAAAGYWLGRSRRGAAIADAATGAATLALTSRLAEAGFDLADGDDAAFE